MTNASSMKMSVEEMIGHYQRSIERSQNDTKRILHCLGKLQRMHVTVKHLQTTGIGKTVNNLRKDDGEVGAAAKVLIQRWKEMVSNHDVDGSKDERKPQEELEYINEDAGQLQLEPISNNEKKSHKTHDHMSKSSSGHSDHHRDQYPLHEHRSPGKSNDNHSHHRKYSSDDTPEQPTHSKHKHKSHSHDEANGKSKRREHEHDSSADDRHKSSSKNSKDDRHHRSRHETQHNGDENSDKKHRNSSKDHSKHSDHDSKLHSNSNEKSQTSSKHKRRRESNHSSTSSPKKQKSDSSKTDEKKSSKSKFKSADDGIEIDNSMGTSFADALGMLAPMPVHSSKATSTTISPSTSGKSLNKSSTVSPSSSQSKTKAKELSKPSTSSKTAATPSLLLKKPKLPPLEDLAKDLPPPPECIIPNDYKPSPVNHMIMDCVFKGAKPMSMLSETDSLCASTTSKNQRTKVYSGVKTGVLLNVLSLHELCIRVLQKNVDAIEYTGGVPFEILRPILERATPEQLDQFENFNPYLMEDSDCLWQQHCQRKFKAYKRLEMETWREMYYRCMTEQESRLSKLTRNIKESQSVALPVRQTKLAYVDSMVKPPRSVIKKQNQFGTHNKLIATPAARTEALSGVASNMTRLGDARLRTTISMRDTAQAQPSNGIFKPKKAPLMAKTLQLMKGRFKR